MNLKLSFYKSLHWLFQNVFPHWSKWMPEPIGLLPLIIHRDILNMTNLYPAPISNDPPTNDPKYRPDNGYGTDKNHPAASAEGSPLGRNCPMVPSHLRNPVGDPDVQLVAQRLLARDSFKPAGDQLNIMAAAWIQAMVHDWVGHFDGDETVVLDKGKASGCPMASFKFKNTKVRPDGEFDNFRTMWWDASFLYGNDKTQVHGARTFVDGKLKVNESDPNVLPMNGDVHAVGDNKNSWVGVSLLQEIFLKEHNAVVKAIKEKHPDMSDDDLFGYGRNVVSALVAKIHTTDWTPELLKTYTLEIGMKTNWMGLPKAFSSRLGFLPPFFRLIEKDKADNKGVPFCLTEEFAAVYRLHPLLPPGLVVGEERNEFIPLEDLVGPKGRAAIRAKPGRALDFWESSLFYPCGHLVPHNYPSALRNVPPTTDEGRALPDLIDLAALDLYRDRERGILPFNDFRRAIQLKPYKTWHELTGETTRFGGKQKETPLADELEAIYGPAPQGLERCDLLVGDMYEGKLRGFAISETSFVIFLLMASRRLDADPFLNEYFDTNHYTQTGLDWVESTNGLKDLLDRHYPQLTAKMPPDHSAFKPVGGPSDWQEAINNGVVTPSIKAVWDQTKAANDKFFGALPN